MSSFDPKPGASPPRFTAREEMDTEPTLPALPATPIQRAALEREAFVAGPRTGGFTPVPPTDASPQTLQEQSEPRPTAPPSQHTSALTGRIQLSSLQAPRHTTTGGFVPVGHFTGQYRVPEEPFAQQRAALPAADDEVPSELTEAQNPTFKARTTQLDPFMTGRLQAIEKAPSGAALRDAFGERPDRLSYGIWGAAIGALVGILFGVLNALFEGVYPSQNQGPLILLTFLGMAVGGGVSAAYPRRMAKLVRDTLFFYS